MTTAAKVDEVLDRFNRKSPRDSYKQVCDELEIHMQKALYKLLPDAPMAWHRIQSLELDHFLLGTRGCMSLLPIITVSTLLRKISLCKCGISDDFVRQMCEILQNHPCVRYVDISGNELVTVYSASSIISLMRNNANMVRFAVEDTHVGTNVGNIIAALGAKNMHNVSTYYEDRYFKMKDLFGYLDEDGRGWVLLKSLLLNCPYPVLQEQFAERIALKRPKKRSDNTISINTFLQLVYMNYKTESEIARYAETTLNEPYLFMIANWKQVMKAVERYNDRVDHPPAANKDDDGEARLPGQPGEAAEEMPQVHLALPAEFHRLRIRDYLLTNENADAIVATAVRLTRKAREEAEEATAATAETNVLTLPIQYLLQANRSSYEQPPSTKPSYQFFVERDAAYVPSVLRNGSRLFDIQDLSMLNSTASTMSSAESVDDSDDAPHTFSLPAMLVKMIVDFFNKEVSKLPKKKESVIPDTPRTKRDKAMEKVAIPIRTFLSAEFTTDFEKLRVRLLADYYSRYALPIDDCTITLQEMVNVLDEMYVQCRVDSIVPLEKIAAMASPLDEDKYAEFFTHHLEDRDEDITIVRANRGSVAY